MNPKVGDVVEIITSGNEADGLIKGKRFTVTCTGTYNCYPTIGFVHPYRYDKATAEGKFPTWIFTGYSNGIFKLIPTPRIKNALGPISGDNL